MIRARHPAQALLAATAVLAVAACGGSPAGGSDTNKGEIAWESPGQGYLAIMGPANQAADRFDKQASTYTDHTTSAEVTRDAAPLADAIHTARNDLLTVDWPSASSVPRPPARTQQDVKEMLKAISAFAEDLEMAGSRTSFSLANWTTRLAQDRRRARAAANIVRADLRLQPVSASAF